MEDNSKLDRFLNQYKLSLAIGFVGLVLLIGGIFSSGIIAKTFVAKQEGLSFVKSTKNPTSFPQAAQLSASAAKVDVSGEVKSPGVYALSASARVEDAIKAAGGVTESADPLFVSKTLNLAQKVSDGMKIYIPKKSENLKLDAGQAGSSGIVAGSQVVAGAQTALININTASSKELETLPKVGPVTAQKIIDKRPYSSIEELLTKKAVNKSVYEEIKGMVSTY